jgi:hypothetical protein
MAADPSEPWPWSRVLLVWSAIGFGVLLSGGVATRALMTLRGGGSVDFGDSFWGALLLFSLGGGIATGLLILVWWLVVKLGFSWTLGFVALALVLFALFVWPTPYRYERTKDPDVRLRITRLTGHGEFIPRAPGQ